MVTKVSLPIPVRVFNSCLCTPLICEEEEGRRKGTRCGRLKPSHSYLRVPGSNNARCMSRSTHVPRDVYAVGPPGTDSALALERAAGLMVSSHNTHHPKMRAPRDADLNINVSHRVSSFNRGSTDRHQLSPPKPGEPMPIFLQAPPLIYRRM